MFAPGLRNHNCKNNLKSKSHSERYLFIFCLFFNFFNLYLAIVS